MQIRGYQHDHISHDSHPSDLGAEKLNLEIKQGRLSEETGWLFDNKLCIQNCGLAALWITNS